MAKGLYREKRHKKLLETSMLEAEEEPEKLKQNYKVKSHHVTYSRKDRRNNKVNLYEINIEK